jgi:hypothetical protein
MCRLGARVRGLYRRSPGITGRRPSGCRSEPKSNRQFEDQKCCPRIRVFMFSNRTESKLSAAKRDLWLPRKAPQPGRAIAVSMPVAPTCPNLGETVGFRVYLESVTPIPTSALHRTDALLRSAFLMVRQAE